MEEKLKTAGLEIIVTRLDGYARREDGYARTEGGMNGGAFSAVS